MLRARTHFLLARACNLVQLSLPQSGQREREKGRKREKEKERWRVRKRKRERGGGKAREGWRERDRDVQYGCFIFIFKRNDGCLGAFYLSSSEISYIVCPSQVFLSSVIISRQPSQLTEPLPSMGRLNVLLANIRLGQKI
jgi:hypothetical protein